MSSKQGSWVLRIPKCVSDNHLISCSKNGTPRQRTWFFGVSISRRTIYIRNEVLGLGCNEVSVYNVIWWPRGRCVCCRHLKCLTNPFQTDIFSSGWPQCLLLEPPCCRHILWWWLWLTKFVFFLYGQPVHYPIMRRPHMLVKPGNWTYSARLDICAKVEFNGLVFQWCRKSYQSHKRVEAVLT